MPEIENSVIPLESGSAAFSVLLVEDNVSYANLVQKFLQRAAPAVPQVTHVITLHDAIDHLAEHEADIILLDLRLPDSSMSDTLSRLIEHCPDVPIIVLTSLDDLELAGQAMRQGAQDYLVKSEINGSLLIRAIGFAIERKKHSLALERSNAELQRFANTVAHEIKSPLAVITSCFDILRRRLWETMDERTQKLISETSSRAEDIVSLVSDLLEFARFDPEIKFENVDTAEIYQDVLSNLRTLIDEKEAKNEAAELPEVFGDRILIRQLLYNLLLNAIKYCEDCPDIRLDCSATHSAWVFSLTDNGIGIDESSKDSIFTVFARAQNARKYSGTGIGLAFCKRIIEHHHGLIWVESELGKGSTFHFTLPAIHE